MSVYLYKNGNSHIENGIKCERIKVEPKAIKRHLDLGYVLQPEFLLEDEKKEELKAPELPVIEPKIEPEIVADLEEKHKHKHKKDKLAKPDAEAIWSR